MFRRLVMASFIFCSVAEGQTPVGLLSRVSGKVEIRRAQGKADTPALTADLLGPGDRVRTEGNSDATFLFCPELRSAKIGANAEIQFEATTLKVLKGSVSEERRVPSCGFPPSIVLALAGASQLQSGMLRLRGSSLVLRSPSHTSIATLRPRFRWDAVEHATAYDLKLMDREERVLWHQSLSSTEVQYPAEAPALVWSQKYWWRVTAREDEEIVTEAGSYFQVLPEEKAEQVRRAEVNLRRMIEEIPADDGPRFLLIFLYEENDMLDEAARVYGELTSRIGTHEWIQSRLVELLSKLGWNQLESGPSR